MGFDILVWAVYMLLSAVFPAYRLWFAVVWIVITVARYRRHIASAASDFWSWICLSIKND